MKQFSALLTGVVCRCYSSLQHTISCFGGATAGGEWGDEGRTGRECSTVGLCPLFFRFLVGPFISLLPPFFFFPSFFLSSLQYAQTYVRE